MSAASSEKVAAALEGAWHTLSAPWTLGALEDKPDAAWKWGPGIPTGAVSPTAFAKLSSLLML